MLALTHIGAWHWAGFIVIILSLLAVDLRLFHRCARVVRLKEALLWSLIWFLLAMIFGCALAQWRGHQEALEYLTGYVIELSLSLDNLLAIVVIFGYFGVAPEQEHRLLFWGILGALAMRGVLIGLGAVLIQMFNWVLLILGAFLIYTGFRWVLSKPQPARPDNNRLIRMARAILPVAAQGQGQKLLTRIQGRLALTPLAVVLLTVEATDLLFAVDSIPAIFAVTRKAFILFSSNVFAVVALRWLYVVVAGAVRYFGFLRTGLAVVLILIGLKMLVSPWYPIATGVSLCAVAAIVVASIVASVVSVAGGGRKS